MRKRSILLLMVCAALLLSGCASEQTIVKKVNEPMALGDVERLSIVTPALHGAALLDIAPDGQTALTWQDGALGVFKKGDQSILAGCEAFAWPQDGAEAICWSSNSRYACVRLPDRTLVVDTDKNVTCALPPVLTACFNADHVTLYYARKDGAGSLFCRQRIFGGEEEQLLSVPLALHGPMFRTTRSQYLVMGDDKLLCLEQPEAGRPWGLRVVADFAASGMRIDSLSYRAQTGLCIVSGETGYDSTAFSVVSPDGKDFQIDQVSCFTPGGETPAVNLPASALHALADSNAYPVRLRRVQLSPGGLYLLLWGQRAADGARTMHLLNLDTGKLTEVALDALPEASWPCIRWCAGKTFLLGNSGGETAVATVSGWVD